RKAGPLCHRATGRRPAHQRGRRDDTGRLHRDRQAAPPRRTGKRTPRQNGRAHHDRPGRAHHDRTAAGTVTRQIAPLVLPHEPRPTLTSANPPASTSHSPRSPTQTPPPAGARRCRVGWYPSHPQLSSRRRPQADHCCVTDPYLRLAHRPPGPFPACAIGRPTLLTARLGRPPKPAVTSGDGAAPGGAYRFSIPFDTKCQYSRRHVTDVEEDAMSNEDT